MVLPVAFIIGAIIGVTTAKRRGGNKLDTLHYGTAFGIAFLLVGLIGSIFFQRIGVF